MSSFLVQKNIYIYYNTSMSYEASFRDFLLTHRSSSFLPLTQSYNSGRNISCPNNDVTKIPGLVHKQIKA
jgi:hypothetical protein